MARFVTGNTFGTTDTVTAAKLNTAVNDAAISTDSVDNNTIELNSNALRLKDSSSKTTGVTFAKMQHISTAQVLGRVSASEGDVEEVGVVIGGSGDAGLLFDNDDMLDNSDTAGGSATRGATQQSIKACVDSFGLTTTLPGQSGGVSTEGEQGSINVGPLIIKYGTINSTGGQTNYSFTNAFPTAIIGVNTTVQERVGSAAYTSGANNVSTSGFELNTYAGASFAAVGRCFFVAYGF